MSQKKLRELVISIINEVEDDDDIEESTATGNVSGYNVPHAFGKPSDEKKKGERLAKASGYSVVGEASKVGKSYNELNEDIKSDLYKIKKGDTIIIKNPDVKGPNYNTPVTFVKYNKLWNWIVAKNKDGKTVKIGIENDPSNTPYVIIKEATNRFHQLRKEDATPNQKIGKGIREMRKQIQEIEKFVEWYSKIKTENGLDSSQYWKRTQRHLNVIRERLNKISQKIQNL